MNVKHFLVYLADNTELIAVMKRYQECNTCSDRKLSKVKVNLRMTDLYFLKTHYKSGDIPGRIPKPKTAEPGMMNRWAGAAATDLSCIMKRFRN